MLHKVLIAIAGLALIWLFTPGLTFLLLLLFFLPTLIAFSKKHPYTWAIFTISTFGALVYGLGWLIGLIWCFFQPGDRYRMFGGSADEIDRLHRLKERGVISQEEFDAGKRTVLGGSIAGERAPD